MKFFSGIYPKYLFLFFLCACLFMLFSGCATKTGYVRTHPYLDKDERDAFMRGEVRPGFDQEMVELVWGAPSNTQSDVTKTSDQEIWLYPKEVWVPIVGTVRSECVYVYFEDGKVVRVKTIKGREKYKEQMDKRDTFSAH